MIYVFLRNMFKFKAFCSRKLAVCFVTSHVAKNTRKSNGGRRQLNIAKGGWEKAAEDHDDEQLKNIFKR